MKFRKTINTIASFGKREDLSSVYHAFICYFSRKQTAVKPQTTAPRAKHSLEKHCFQMGVTIRKCKLAACAKGKRSTDVCVAVRLQSVTRARCRLIDIYIYIDKSRKRRRKFLRSTRVFRYELRKKSIFTNYLVELNIFAIICRAV